ncbi:hypothetical protein TNCV_1861131 [Trichonephila clavipes]|nr:hypothetical protein TNCV_1861131 [Trichonephila clavipes]
MTPEVELYSPNFATTTTGGDRISQVIMVTKSWSLLFLSCCKIESCCYWRLPYKRARLDVEHPSGGQRPPTNITRGLTARQLFKVPPAMKALYIYKQICLTRDSNPVPTAQQSASLTTILDGWQTLN